MLASDLTDCPLIQECLPQFCTQKKRENSLLCWPLVSYIQKMSANAVLAKRSAHSCCYCMIQWPNGDFSTSDLWTIVTIKLGIRQCTEIFEVKTILTFGLSASSLWLLKDITRCKSRYSLFVIFLEIRNSCHMFPWQLQCDIWHMFVCIDDQIIVRERPFDIYGGRRLPNMRSKRFANSSPHPFTHTHTHTHTHSYSPVPETSNLHCM